MHFKPVSSGERKPVLYELPTILKPLDLADLFPRSQPLEIELGCGDGSFLAEWAGRHPERNFIGVERLLGRIRKLDRKGNGLCNLRCIRIESSYFLRWLVPSDAAVAFHVYFPDPWPKRRHHRHRLVNPDFPLLTDRILISGGHIFLRTDDSAYYEQMLHIFAASPLFEPRETPLELAALKTDFEREFQARGIRTLRAAYAKR
jgi:tRNA (guanine-N7-)-methyltransferase